MKHLFLSLLCFTVLLSACSDEQEATHPYLDFFFPYNEEAKFYIYRDVVHGLNEKFLRVYGIEDSFGKHIVVENYTMDGRITEALNYNIDSLNIMDHMVVDRNGQNQKTMLMKDAMFPMTPDGRTWFASKFPGFQDSTLILSETKRSFFKSSPVKTKVMGENTNTIIMLDTLRMTQFNPFTKRESEISGVIKSYFAEGLGLVRFHDLNKKSDFQLEKIITQQEWVKMMQR